MGRVAAIGVWCCWALWGQQEAVPTFRSGVNLVLVPVVVRANLNWDEVARVEVNVPELPGVSIEEGLTRYYPFGEMGSHIVGYVAAVSEKELTGDPLLELPDFRIGKNGVELYHDLQLRGTAGARRAPASRDGDGDTAGGPDAVRRAALDRRLRPVPGAPAQAVRGGGFHAEDRVHHR